MTGQEKLEKMAKVIPEFISSEKPKKIRRGFLHNSVCRILKIPRSNQNVRLIKAIVLSIGAREVIIRGRMHYSTFTKGLSEKKD